LFTAVVGRGPLRNNPRNCDTPAILSPQVINRDRPRDQMRRHFDWIKKLAFPAKGSDRPGLAPSDSGLD